MVVAADEVGVVVVVEVGVELRGMEAEDMITMVMAMEETAGESTFVIPPACVDSIDCYCSGVYHL